MVKVARKELTLRREHQLNKEVATAAISDSSLRQITSSGAVAPQSIAERHVARYVDTVDLNASDEDPQAQKGAAYNHRVHSALRYEHERREKMLSRYAQSPTSKEYYKLFKNLRDSDGEEEEIARYQRRLVEEHGIYPTTRMDAYMLDDDTFFPAWVSALPYSIRDRVRYGAMGLTEEDEALRVRLGRLPLDKRRREWDRLKAAKEYKASLESSLTAAEIRDMRQGKRRFHWLQRKQNRRASDLRRLALRKPEEQELWPSDVVDYSQRLAYIAQHVENEVETNGQWPLDPDVLAKAKLARVQERARGDFITSETERRMQNTKLTMSKEIGSMLDELETKEKPFRRLSRKKYAHRVNAVVHGDQDEYGRKYRRMEQLARNRQRAYESVSDIALEKEIRSEPRINIRGLNHRADEHWTRHTRSWVDGMPSMRYGS